MMFAALSMCSDLVENVKSYATGFYGVYTHLKKERPNPGDVRLGEKDTTDYDRNNKSLYHKKNTTYDAHTDTVTSEITAKKKKDTVRIETEIKSKLGLRYKRFYDKEGTEIRVYEDKTICYIFE